MPKTLVIHSHEVWLKGRNRNYFLGRLRAALECALEGLPYERVEQLSGRYLVWFGEDDATEAAIARVKRVFGVVNFGVATTASRELESMREVAWQVVREEKFRTFAVRAKRGDKSYPLHSNEIERDVGAYLLAQLRAAGREVRVDLTEPDLTCFIEITPGGPVFVYARKIPGPGGLPANTAGRLVCLLSGGFDSAVAAYKMMKRGAHILFVHFYGIPARPGESSVPVAREIVEKLTPYQLSSKLYLVPFDPIQREIVLNAPEGFRILLYRRMMLRIAEAIGREEHAWGMVTGDSLAQVASQTLQNMYAVGEVATLPVYRPLVGDDKQEILKLARELGTYEISCEPFQDCCPMFLPKRPVIHARLEEVREAEARLETERLIRTGLASVAVERFRYRAGQVEAVAALAPAAAPKPSSPAVEPK